MRVSFTPTLSFYYNFKSSAQLFNTVVYLHVFTKKHYRAYLYVCIGILVTASRLMWMRVVSLAALPLYVTIFSNSLFVKLLRTPYVTTYDVLHTYVNLFNLSWRKLISRDFTHQSHHTYSAVCANDCRSKDKAVRLGQISEASRLDENNRPQETDPGEASAQAIF